MPKYDAHDEALGGHEEEEEEEEDDEEEDGRDIDLEKNEDNPSAAPKKNHPIDQEAEDKDDDDERPKKLRAEVKLNNFVVVREDSKMRR